MHLEHTFAYSAPSNMSLQICIVPLLIVHLPWVKSHRAINFFREWNSDLKDLKTVKVSRWFCSHVCFDAPPGNLRGRYPIWQTCCLIMLGSTTDLEIIERKHTHTHNPTFCRTCGEFRNELWVVHPKRLPSDTLNVDPPLKQSNEGD